MIELEIQALSERREGLLVEVGHFVIENGFTLQRQRLVQDPHGILLTMVVRGPPRRKRALESALGAYERIISFELTSYVEGQQRPHFAASRAIQGYVPAAMPKPGSESAAKARTDALATPNVAVTPTTASVAFDRIAPARITAAPAATPVPMGGTSAPPEVDSPSQPGPDFEYILPEPQWKPPVPPPVVVQPFVERIPLEPDQAAVDEMLSTLDTDYPQIVPRLLTLARSVAEDAREPSLRLAGQRVGRWVSGREHAQADKLDLHDLNLHDAIGRIGIPTLRALVEVEQDGSQVHVRDSPLCTEGHSGCTFFSGFLEGVLGPALASGEVTIFPVCCCSYGADDCVLALSD